MCFGLARKFKRSCSSYDFGSLPKAALVAQRGGGFKMFEARNSSASSFREAPM